MEKISFDFDTTLRMPDGSKNNDGMKKILAAMLDPKKEVMIVTSRNGSLNDEHNKDLVKFLDDNDMNKLPVHFTDNKSKADTLVKLGVDVHYDDDKWEIEDLEGTSVKGIRVPFDLALWKKIMIGNDEE